MTLRKKMAFLACIVSITSLFGLWMLKKPETSNHNLSAPFSLLNKNFKTKNAQNLKSIRSEVLNLISDENTTYFEKDGMVYQRDKKTGQESKLADDFEWDGQKLEQLKEILEGKLDGAKTAKFVNA